MNITITGRHLEVTPALRSYVNKRLARLERYTEEIDSAHVVLSVTKNQQHIEATIPVKSERIFADASHDSMYAAIDALADRLARQLLEHKKKHQRRDRASGGLHPHIYDA